jgi:heterodisulfide reductase subunit C
VIMKNSSFWDVSHCSMKELLPDYTKLQCKKIIFLKYQSLQKGLIIQVQTQWNRRSRKINACWQCGTVADGCVIHFRRFDGNQLRKSRVIEVEKRPVVKYVSGGPL